MTFQVDPLKGLYTKEKYVDWLRSAEGFVGYRRCVLIVFAVSMVVYAIAATFGFRSEWLSAELVTSKASLFEAKQQLYWLGYLLAGLVMPVILVFGSSLYYWGFLNVPYRKLVVVNYSVWVIFILEKCIQIPLFLALNIDYTSNPFSLGVLAQYVTDSQLFVYFCSEITLFQLWMVTTVSFYLKRLSGRNDASIVILVTVFFFGYWFINSLLSYIKMGIFM